MLFAFRNDLCHGVACFLENISLHFCVLLIKFSSKVLPSAASEYNRHGSGPHNGRSAQAHPTIAVEHIVVGRRHIGQIIEIRYRYRRIFWLASTGIGLN